MRALAANGSEGTMTKELQELLERIQQEGIAKARTEGDAIVHAARHNAEEIIAKAKAEADALRAAAERDSQAFAQRGEQSVRQASRDVLLETEKALQALFERALRPETSKVLASADLMPRLIAEAVSAYLQAGSGEVSVRLSGQTAALAEAVSARLREAAAAPGGLEVTTDEAGLNGFSIRLSGGRIEHSFTTDAVVDALGRLLRPRLAELLKAGSTGKPA